MVQGRIVWTSGDLFQGRPKVDQTTKQPRMGKDGKQMIEYGFGLAVPKSILGDNGAGRPGEVWAAMHREAMSILPGAQQVPASFAMKYKDGDGIDDKGVPFAQRAGYKDCIVLACTTTIPIKYFKFDPSTNQNFQIGEGIKCGDYVNVQLGIKAHPAMGTSRAGLYLNPMAVQLVGYGDPIVNTPSGDNIFGNTAPVVPQGASAHPVAPTAGFLTAPQTAPVMPMAPSFQQPAPPMGNAAPQVQPHYGVVPQQFQPQAAPAMPAIPQYAAQPQVATGPGVMPPAYPSSPGMPSFPPPMSR